MQNMELIPYTSREGREIVLRHRNALVVRDPASHRLEIRGLSLTECPTCHQPLRQSSPERSYEAPPQHESYVDPGYFRMLQAGYLGGDEQPQPRPPSSPIRRLTQPALPASVEDEAEFLSSTPAPHEGARIRRDAFSPNYFNRFFVEERELGRGGKGVVLLVRHEIDGLALGHFACKRVPVGDDHAWLEKVLVEVELLAKLSHPNLVSYRHVWLEDVQLHRFGPSVASAFILQQYCNGGDLLRYVIGDQPAEMSKEQLKAQMRRKSRSHGERPQGISPSQRRLSLEEIYSLFRDITSGLAYLHAANYIHRDLKPSNCLLHREGNKLTCLISDFGEVQPENAIRKSTGTTGTISYCAPEVLKTDVSGHFGNFTTKSDVFSLGMILFFLCFGRLPYRNANIFQEELEDIDLLRAEIADWRGFQGEMRERSDLPAKLYQLLKRMLALKPPERPSAAEVLNILTHESTHNGIRSSSPSVGLRNRKIQNLDSPMAPGTPVPEPVKHQYRHNNGINNNMSVAPIPAAPAPGPASDSGDDITVTSFSERSPHASPDTSLQKRHSAHYDKAPNLALSNSQDGYIRHSSPDDDDEHHHHHLQHHRHHDGQPLSPALLMPPPPSYAITLRILGHPALQQFVFGNVDSLAFLFRLGLFVVKMTALFRPCWPYMVSVEAAVPLVGIAALDLGMPGSGGGHGSSNGLQRRHRPYGVPARGWRLSVVAFVLHFFVLAVFSRRKDNTILVFSSPCGRTVGLGITGGRVMIYEPASTRPAPQTITQEGFQVISQRVARFDAPSPADASQLLEPDLTDAEAPF
ncbi:putative serine/threonine-protein kinase iks1 [Diatrype stigma]|uniref:non-specific serine/threonine protein kinase n=1 Tax=Diatrype stigma TaxID=117547 RepID=A0AAN9YSM0_9PEZI